MFVARGTALASSQGRPSIFRQAVCGSRSSVGCAKLNKMSREVSAAARGAGAVLLFDVMVSCCHAPVTIHSAVLQAEFQLMGDCAKALPYQVACDLAPTVLEKPNGRATMAYHNSMMLDESLRISVVLLQYNVHIMIHAIIGITLWQSWVLVVIAGYHPALIRATESRRQMNDTGLYDLLKVQYQAHTQCTSCACLHDPMTQHMSAAVQDTIVKDPFYKHMPVHFDMTFQELLAAKHPTTWIDFEKGNLTEDQALAQFFADGREVDAKGLKGMLVCALLPMIPVVSNPFR